jgi:hypothetical protein
MFQRTIWPPSSGPEIKLINKPTQGGGKPILASAEAKCLALSELHDVKPRRVCSS